MKGRCICWLILDLNLLKKVLQKVSGILKVQFYFIREYDVPYHVRAAIDLKIFVVSEKTMDKYKLNSILERLLALSVNYP